MVANTSTVKLQKADTTLDVVVRPIKKTDKDLETEFIENLSPETRHYRFLGGVNKLSDADIEKLCDVNLHDSMAYIATVSDTGDPRQIGVVRYQRDKSGKACEMALTIADDFRETELSSILMEKLLAHAREEGVEQIYSTEFRDNKAMKKLAKKYNMQAIDEPGMRTEVRYVLDL